MMCSLDEPTQRHREAEATRLVLAHGLRACGHVRAKSDTEAVSAFRLQLAGTEKTYFCVWRFMRYANLWRASGGENDAKGGRGIISEYDKKWQPSLTSATKHIGAA